jgi:hypothetical protein
MNTEFENVYIILFILEILIHICYTYKVSEHLKIAICGPTFEDSHMRTDV